MELQFPLKKFLGSARLGIQITIKEEGLPENVEGVIEFLAGRHIIKEATFTNFNELIIMILHTVYTEYCLKLTPILH